MESSLIETVWKTIRMDFISFLLHTKKENQYSKYFLLLLFYQTLEYILLILNKIKIDFS
jgi:hypothetical protein